MDLEKLLPAEDAPARLAIPGYGAIVAYRSLRDGVLVVEIDTGEASVEAGTVDEDGEPRLRVLVNEDTVWHYDTPEPQMTVRLFAAYADGYEAPPVDTDLAEPVEITDDWWDEVVFPLTGTGRGGEAKYTAVVITAHTPGHVGTGKVWG